MPTRRADDHNGHAVCPWCGVEPVPRGADSCGRRDCRDLARMRRRTRDRERREEERGLRASR